MSTFEQLTAALRALLFLVAAGGFMFGHLELVHPNLTVLERARDWDQFACLIHVLDHLCEANVRHAALFGALECGEVVGLLHERMDLVCFHVGLVAGGAVLLGLAAHGEAFLADGGLAALTLDWVEWEALAVGAGELGEDNVLACVELLEHGLQIVEGLALSLFDH